MLDLLRWRFGFSPSEASAIVERIIPLLVSLPVERLVGTAGYGNAFWLAWWLWTSIRFLTWVPGSLDLERFAGV